MVVVGVRQFFFWKSGEVVRGATSCTGTRRRRVLVASVVTKVNGKVQFWYNGNVHLAVAITQITQITQITAQDDPRRRAPNPNTVALRHQCT